MIHPKLDQTRDPRPASPLGVVSSEASSEIPKPTWIMPRDEASDPPHGRSWKDASRRVRGIVAGVAGGLLVAGAVTLGVSVAPGFLSPAHTPERAHDDQALALPALPAARPSAAHAPPHSVRATSALQAGEALSTALARQGVSVEDIAALASALRGHVDVRDLRTGQPFTVDVDPTGPQPALLRFELPLVSLEGVPRTLHAARSALPRGGVGMLASGPSSTQSPMPSSAPSPMPAATSAPTAASMFAIRVEDAAVQTVVEGMYGVVQSSIYQAILDAGGDASLVNKFVDVFAWNVDFYRQSQPGDEFRLLVEKRYVGEGDERRALGHGQVVAAEYVNAGVVHRGFLFASKDKKHQGTYDSDGNALQRTFLKNPLAITRVTSRYGMRFHPVSGKNKKHQGVDYGAPVGTPVWSVADGVVREARYSKTAGNMVRIEHHNGIFTEYFHLATHAAGLKPGKRVTQKQVIGTVGSTGVSSGPHLHYGMLRGGSHVDPQRQKFPSSKPLPREYQSEFDALVKPLLAELKGLGRV